jgi:hypothetical protein
VCRPRKSSRHTPCAVRAENAVSPLRHTECAYYYSWLLRKGATGSASACVEYVLLVNPKTLAEPVPPVTAHGVCYYYSWLTESYSSVFSIVAATCLANNLEPSGLK